MTVATIRIPGRGRANVLDAGCLPRLVETLQAAEAGGAVGAVLHGPPGHFAAGADLEELQRLDGAGAHSFGGRGIVSFRQLRRTGIWLAAAVDGPCIGGGLDLALACDLLLATPRAIFRHPGTRLGFPTTYGGNRGLPRRIGAAGARALLLCGRDLSAREARALGLVDELAEPGKLLSRAAARLQRWAEAMSVGARRAFLEVARRDRGLPLSSAIRLERVAFQAAGTASAAGPRSC